jgi:tRNA G37 N-methylase Trm5
LEIQRDEKLVYIPLVRRPSAEELKTLKEQVPACKISIHSFPERKQPTTSLAQLLEDKLPPHLLVSLPHAIDFVGDIAIVEVPLELDARAFRFVTTVFLGTFFSKGLRIILIETGRIEKKLSGLC